MESQIDIAKRMCYSRWQRELPFLKTRVKTTTYGRNETPDTIWDKLPKLCQEYWLGKVN